MQSYEQYKEKLNASYRAIVIAYMKAIEHSYDDREISAQGLFEMAKSRGLTDRDSMSANWLRNRVYHVDRYRSFPKWIAQAAYYCLLTVKGWQPKNGIERFGMAAFYIKENGSALPQFDDLLQDLPSFLDDEEGHSTIRECIDSIHSIHDYRASNRPSELE